MPLRVSGKNLDIGDSLRQHVVSRVNVAVGKYFDGGVTGHVTLGRDGSAYRSDCTLHLSSGITLQAEGKAHEPYASFEQAAERIEKRLRRYKSRIKERKHDKAEAGGVTVASYVLEAPDQETEAPAEDFAPTVIAETTTRLGAMTIAAAVMELDMTGVTVLPFRHAASGRVNIIYRRNDGNIGWLDPAGDDKA